MKKFFLFPALLCCIYSGAQLVRTPVSVLYPSLTTYSTRFKDAFSFCGNAASLAGVKQFSAGVFSERRFLLQELSNYSFAAALPTTSGGFGLQGSYFGASLYNETTIGFAYGRSVGSKADVGLQFQYHTLSSAGYGSASTLTFDAGAVFHLTDVLCTGISVYNPVGMKFGKTEEEKLPAIYSAGLGYDVSPQFFLAAEAQKTEDQPVSVNVGFQYLFAEKLLARAGISSAASVYYIGFGVKLNNLRVDVTSSFHPYLGATPGLMLVYSSPK